MKTKKTLGTKSLKNASHEKAYIFCSDAKFDLRIFSWCERNKIGFYFVKSSINLMWGFFLNRENFIKNK